MTLEDIGVSLHTHFSTLLFPVRLFGSPGSITFEHSAETEAGMASMRKTLLCQRLLAMQKYTILSPFVWCASNADCS